MSAVQADTFGTRDGTQTIPATTLTQGTAKMWSNLNGTGTIAPRDDFNVASYVDNGVGDYTANLSAARPNANYAVVAQLGQPPAVDTGAYVFGTGVQGNVNPTTTAYRMSPARAIGSAIDAAFFMTSLFGDP